MSPPVVDRVVKAVARDLEDGTWDARHGWLRSLDDLRRRPASDRGAAGVAVARSALNGRSLVVHEGVTRGGEILQAVYGGGERVSQAGARVLMEGVGSAADIHPRNHCSPVHAGRANCCSVFDSRGGGRRRRRSSLHPAAGQRAHAALSLGHPGPPRSLANEFLPLSSPWKEKPALASGLFHVLNDA